MTKKHVMTIVLLVMVLPLGCSRREHQVSQPVMTAERLERANSLGLDPKTPRGLTRLVQVESMTAMRESLERSLVPGQPWHVLALSGGGQWGAFGAGFMKGWTQRTTEPKRPEFRVVTGTSTGSLIATFAFLGSGFDDALRDAYLGIRGDDDVFENRWLVGLVFGDALSSTKPLRRRLNGFITPEVLAKVAEEGRRGRRLFVGSVDLDHGTFKPWDLTEIASRGGEQARQQYIDALMASTAIPVAFPPVVIGDTTYVDGGVRRNIFLEIVVSEAQRFRTLEASAPSQATVYCLVNGTLDVGTRVVRRRVLDIARRSVDILLDESTDGNLLRIYLLAKRAGLGFQVAHIPALACASIGSEEHQFDPTLMKCLYDEGQRTARDEAEPWLAEPVLGSLKP